MAKIYCAGHCLTRGSQMQRAIEKEELAQASPNATFYNPMENKTINDKANLDNNEGLAEKIVKADTDAIMWSDTVVLEPLPEACGTMVELGQLLGMKDVSEQILRILGNEDMTDLQKLQIIDKAVNTHLNRKVYPHYEDIRRFKGVTESEDRRSLGINQYIYGACLKLTDGKGFYEWEEILAEIAE